MSGKNEEMIEKYSRATRILHHIHTLAFVVLFLSGLVLFVPALGFLAQDSWTRIIHRVGSVIFILAPILYTVLKPRAAITAVKEAFTWGKDDLGWLKAAPRYYFLSDERGMPAQGHMNTGQKLWWLIVLLSGVTFILTGLIMWFFKTIAPNAVLQWMVFLHDIAFIAAVAMLFVHIYLGVIHPMMTESWSAISKGTVSRHYAESHHGKWYEEQLDRDSKKDS